MADQLCASMAGFSMMSAFLTVQELSEYLNMG